MDLHTPQQIPDAFIESHYEQAHVMAILGVTEPQFWGLYTEGRIPRGVSLMALVGQPLLVWPRRVLDEWASAGFPAEPGAIELQAEVLNALKDAYAEAGCVFPSDPAEEIERADFES